MKETTMSETDEILEVMEALEKIDALFVQDEDETVSIRSLSIARKSDGEYSVLLSFKIGPPATKEFPCLFDAIVGIARLHDAAAEKKKGRMS
jgi:hypothetical protein